MEQTISIKTLIEFFKNKNKYFINEVKGHTGIPDNSDDGEQGEYNEYFRFYKHPDLPEGVFLRETYQTDSYGYDRHLTKYEFVKGKEKTITVFEPIN